MLIVSICASLRAVSSTQLRVVGATGESCNKYHMNVLFK